MKIRVIAGGIFGADGEIPAGSEFDIIDGPVPEAWAKKVQVIIEPASAEAVPVTNPAKTKKREGLEKQAAELGLGFNDGATDDELIAAIKTAKDAK